MLLLFYLFSFEEVRQLSKFPILIQHFWEHKNQNPKTTVVSFLVLHYWNGDVKDSDYQKDMQLPFKKHDFISNMIIGADFPKSIECDFEYISSFYTSIQRFIYKKHFINEFHYSIFQPPEFVINTVGN